MNLLKFLGATLSLLLDVISGLALMLWAIGTILAIIIIIGSLAIAVVPSVGAYIIRAWVRGERAGEALEDAMDRARNAFTMKAANEK